MVLESGAFGRCLSNENGTLMNGTTVLIKKNPTDNTYPFRHVRTQKLLAMNQEEGLNPSILVS